ncbi:MAG: mevalonate kinase [Candidatus Ranarchaeia archaeon]|jgi:mevalonate kinase
MGKGFGYGKTILFGEHFVVYGLPALASAIGSRTTAVVERISNKGYELHDNRPEISGYKKKKFEEQTEAIKKVLNFMNLDLETQGIKITFAGDLVCASGVGASAANCVSLARAVNDEFNLGWDDDQINSAGYEGEKGYHGTPSGIDNTASTFGGLVYFIRNLEGGPNTVETIQLKEPVKLVIASSGMTANTKDVVADVKKLKESKPDWFRTITKEYLDLVKKGRQALENLDLETVGQMMDKNHALLQQITVSNQVLDKMVKIAKDAGALGAKVTGTGRGGNMISLTPTTEIQNTVANALVDAGHRVWKTTIGA